MMPVNACSKAIAEDATPVNIPMRGAVMPSESAKPAALIA